MWTKMLTRPPVSNVGLYGTKVGLKWVGLWHMLQNEMHSIGLKEQSQTEGKGERERERKFHLLIHPTLKLHSKTSFILSLIRLGNQFKWPQINVHEILDIIDSHFSVFKSNQFTWRGFFSFPFINLRYVLQIILNLSIIFWSSEL